MTHEASDRDELIGRYVDGLMTEPEAAAFRARLAGDAGLRREVALQSEVEASLKRTFGPVPRVSTPSVGGGEVGGGARSTGARGSGGRAGGRAGGPWGGRRLLVYGVAAAAAAIVIVGVIDWQGGLFAPAGPAQQLYASKERDGFSYKWACESDAEFMEHTTVMFGQALVADSTASARIVGWDYVPESWNPAVGLLVGKVEGADVLVVIEPPGCGGGHLRPISGKKLSVFSRRIGEVMIHEITPLDHPGTLELFRIP